MAPNQPKRRRIDNEDRNQEQEQSHPLETNYFVCTLGEACSVPGGRPFTDVNNLIAEQARHHGELPAIGFFGVSGTGDSMSLEPETFTFKQIQQGILVTAELLAKSLEKTSPNQTVGLLCSSSPEFLFTWLACIKLRHPILLIAPECSVSGIASLCQDCEVSILFADEKNQILGQKAAQYKLEDRTTSLVCCPLPFQSSTVFDTVRLSFSSRQPLDTTQETQVAYLHHTSGTSSGKPKPIPQTHRGAVGVLPAIDGRESATFTTTPLYHAGPADIFRAWTSNAMIWMFPSKDLPITAANVIKCLECAGAATDRNSTPPVKFFTSVPYVLQMMTEDQNGMECLQDMDLVGVGGAALPRAVGDELVKNGVNLVSRFGSAECGFLLSSHRNDSEDTDWQYLRLSDRATQLKFEQRENGLSELIVLSDWPHMAKRNRKNGSFATSDLFEPHTRIKNAWKYHSRADAQLTLVTGKKFDPAPIEGALATSSPSIADALVFGNDKPYPGTLIFRSEQASDIKDDDLVNEVELVIQKVNDESQSHARIPSSMIVPMPYTVKPLEKSSKGTVLRKKAEERYVSDIEAAYEKIDATSSEHVPDEKLIDAIKHIVERFLPADYSLSDGTDLFTLGVDSVAAVQIRRSLQQLCPKDSGRLPISIVEDCSTAARLAEHIKSVRSGQSNVKKADASQEREDMLNLVEEYSNFYKASRAHAVTNGVNGHQDAGEVVVLTGATGALGTHVLDQLRSKDRVSKIYCLVRGADTDAAYARVGKALEQRQLAPLQHVTDGPEVVVLRADLRHASLDLDEETYRQVSREATTIIHLAWSVNFRMKLRSFEKDNIAGLRNLINLALDSSRPECPKFAFCSSVASAIAFDENVIPEAILDDPSSASDIGYSQSKWVAEHICHNAHENTTLRGRISVFRVGQLSGDSRTGVWTTKEAWPMMLSTVKLTKCLPELRHEVLNWLPVDIAATAMIEGAFGRSTSDDMCVYHVVNDNTYPTWADLLQWLKDEVSFEIVSPLQWVQRLERLADDGNDHPALQLLDFWKQAYRTQKATEDVQPIAKRFGMDKTKDSIAVLNRLEPVNDPYVRKLWSWIRTNV